MSWLGWGERQLMQWNMNIQALQPLIDTIGILQRPLAGNSALDDCETILQQIITEIPILHICTFRKQFSRWGGRRSFRCQSHFPAIQMEL